MKCHSAVISVPPIWHNQLSTKSVTLNQDQRLSATEYDEKANKNRDFATTSVE